MYLAGVSVRRVEDITEALWGTRVSPGTVSNLNSEYACATGSSRHERTIYAKIEEWRNRRIPGQCWRGQHTVGRTTPKYEAV